MENVCFGLKKMLFPLFFAKNWKIEKLKKLKTHWKHWQNYVCLPGSGHGCIDLDFSWFSVFSVLAENLPKWFSLCIYIYLYTTHIGIKVYNTPFEPKTNWKDGWSRRWGHGGGVTTIEEHKEEVGGRSLGGGSWNMLVWNMHICKKMCAHVWWYVWMLKKKCAYKYGDMYICIQYVYV